MAATVGTMATLGWITDTALTIDRVFTYWLASSYSQTYVNYEMIHSFQYLLAMYDGDPERVEQVVTEDLSNLFEGYFPGSVTVECSHVFPDPNNQARYHLNIYLTGILNGKDYNMAKALDVSGSTWRELNIRT